LSMRVHLPIVTAGWSMSTTAASRLESRIEPPVGRD
jgi:hypothetical protein